jgi:hypothetical protein
MSRTVQTALAVVLLNVALTASAFAQSRTVTVYVETAGKPNALTERIADSVNDLTPLREVVVTLPPSLP